MLLKESEEGFSVAAVRALEKAGFRIVRQGRHIVMSDGIRVVGQFRCKCPINFSLSRRYDKLKLIGHKTDPPCLFMAALIASGNRLKSPPFERIAAWIVLLNVWPE